MSDDYTPQAWRLEGFYPETYAKHTASLDIGIDYDDDRFDQYEAEFRADLEAHDREVRADAVMGFATHYLPHDLWVKAKQYADDIREGNA